MVYSATWAEHMQLLAEVFQRKKCAFAQQEVRCLGHIVGRGVSRPQKEKMEAVQKLPAAPGQKGHPALFGACRVAQALCPKLFH